jgi:hypothetical protein
VLLYPLAVPRRVAGLHAKEGKARIF